MVSSVPRNAQRRRFQLLVDGLGAADEAHGGQAVAPLVEGRVGGCDDVGMVGQAEVVVGAHVEDTGSVGDVDMGVLGGEEQALGFPGSGGADFFEAAG